MNTNIILFLALAILLVLAYRFWEPFVDSPKQELPEGNANLYFFYTNWCGWSKKAMPEWESLEELLRTNNVFGNTKVKLVRVNAEEDTKTTKLYGVDGYPTILLETSNELKPFKGQRTTENLMQFLRREFGKEGDGL